MSDVLHVGVSASRRGLTLAQRAAAYRELGALLNHTVHLHHGDCVGGDVQLAGLADSLGMVTVAHPPTRAAYRGWHPSTQVLPPLPYLPRNRAIVAASAILLAFPAEADEQVYGAGTWYTIRHARARAAELGGEWPGRVRVYGPDGELLT
jgi:hypothetical protein